MSSPCLRLRHPHYYRLLRLQLLRLRYPHYKMRVTKSNGNYYQFIIIVIVINVVIIQILITIGGNKVLVYSAESSPTLSWHPREIFYGCTKRVKILQMTCDSFVFWWIG